MSRTKTPKGRPEAPISTVERETGLSKDTLRVWERRYGFPLPRRNSQGERMYPPEQIEKLRIISRLLDRGMRPAQLMKVPLKELIARAQAPGPLAAEARHGAASPAPGSGLSEALEYLKRYDEAGLRAQLSRALLRLGLQRFAIEFVAPLNELVGEAWARGELAVSQEHMYTEQMQHLLRQGIVSIQPGAPEPSVMLTTLPGEEHQLGILMAHACLAAEGAQCLSLGVQTPAMDIAEAARRREVDAIGLSFSEALKLNVAYGMLQDLRAIVPAGIEIWAGGRLWTRARREVAGVRFMTLLTQIPEALAALRVRRSRPALDS